MFDNAPAPDGNPMDEIKKLLGQMNTDDPIVRAKMNDNRLLSLAEYDVTKGLTEVKDLDQTVLQDRFAEFKRLVKKGSFKLDELEDDVYSRWGIQDGPRNTPEDQTAHEPIGFNFSTLPVADIEPNSPEDH